MTKSTQPNIIFIMTDDHAAHAMSCYGSHINTTPNLDRIAREGIRFNNCFCTNSICEPSRATILTGTYNHINKVTTLGAHIDNRDENVAKILKRNGYQTSIIGKWHLGQGPKHWPTGFDHYSVLDGQGPYFNPVMTENGKKVEYTGYTTDIITDLCLDWLNERDPDRPFCMMCHHKAPHRTWIPDEKHAHMYDDIEIPLPESFDDDYSTRTEAAHVATMTVEKHMSYEDLKLVPPEGEREVDFIPVPDDLSGFSLTTRDGETTTFTSHQELKRWKYQRYIKDYLRCIASVDDNTGRLLDYLDDNGLTENTIVIYTSDQGFFLGDHGWYDKRFMYEESLRMPYIMRYPREIKPGSVSDTMILNVDFAPTWLDYAGIEIPEEMQGYSFRSICSGIPPDNWRTSMYYRYWMHLAHHNVYAHYGIRTHDHKLIYYYADDLGQPFALKGTKEPAWELFDLQKDPREINNVYNDPEYSDILKSLKDELHIKQAEVKDERYYKDVD